MKKIMSYILVVFIVFLSFLGIASAVTGNHQCDLQDTSKWEYANNYYYATKDESGEKDGKLIYCCSRSRGNSSYVCDEYEPVKKTNSDTSQNSSGGNTSSDTSQNSGGGDTKICSDSGLIPTYKFIGNIIRIAKIFIPIIIIVYGMVDLFRALTSAKPEEITKSLKTLLYRAIAGVLVFFLPAIINLIFSWVDNWSSNYENETKSCFNCIWDVSNCGK